MGVTWGMRPVIQAARRPQALALGCRWGQVRQPVQRPRQVVHAELAVDVQRQLGVGVPGQLLHDLHRRAALDQQRHEGRPQGVEVDHAAGVVGLGQELGIPALSAFLPIAHRLDPLCLCSPQVRPHHQCRFLGHRGKHGGGSGAIVQPAAQQIGQVSPDRLSVIAPVFRVGRVQDDRRRVIVQPEVRRRQAAQLGRAESRAGRDVIEHRPIGAGHPVPYGAGRGCVQQQPKFVGVQRAPLILAVRRGVVPGQVGQGIIAHAPVAFQPAGELLNRPQVMVAGLEACALGVPVADRGLHRRRRQVAHALCLDRGQDGVHAPPQQSGLLGRDALCDQTRDPVVHVAGQGVAVGLGVPIIADIHDAVAPQGCIGHTLRQDAFCGGAVGGLGGPLLAPAIMIEPAGDPRAAPAPPDQAALPLAPLSTRHDLAVLSVAAACCGGR